MPHMPGPWKIEGEFDADVSVTICSEDSRDICELSTFLDGDWTEEEIANARLIAAAPELLEALKDYRKRFFQAIVHAGSDEEFAYIACESADNVIAKAEGR